MENLDKLFFKPKQAIDMIKDSIVVIDTNVLLSGYQWKEVTINEVINILKSLVEEKRLRIPHHVIKEFFKNRPGLILNTLRELNDLKSQISFHKRPLNQVAPIFSDNHTFKPLFALEVEVKKKIDEYKNELEKAKKNLLDLFESDHILDEYKGIFENTYYVPKNYDEAKLIADFSERCKKRIPPGYKDSGKNENSHGDYVIWDSILSIGKEGFDILFVSCDTKYDWVYCDQNDHVISTRRELIEEFCEITEGKTFRFITPNEFILLFKPDISTEVKKDLETSVIPVVYNPDEISNLYKYIENSTESYRNFVKYVGKSTEPFIKMIEQFNKSTEPIREAINRINIYNNLPKRFCPRCGEDTYWNGVICTNCGIKDFD